MIREQKNKFWLTLILILSLSFSAFALGIANIFSTKKENAVHADAATGPVYFEDKVGDPTDANNNGNTEENLWKKNGSSFVSTIGEITGGATISVSTATDLNSDESWHSELKVVISGSTSNNGTYQPYIQNGYRLVGFYFQDAKKNNYQNTDAADTNKELFTADERATSEEIDPNYTGKITIKAVCEPVKYNVFMHYSTDGINWQQTSVEFDVENETPMNYNKTIPAGANVQEFKSWAIRSDASELDVDSDLDCIKIGNIKFTNRGSKPELKTSSDRFSYYQVDRIEKGSYSSVINNFKNEAFTTTNPQIEVGNYDPVIRATWSYKYQGLIKNEGTNSIDPTKVGTWTEYGVVKDGQPNSVYLPFWSTKTGFFNNVEFCDNKGSAFITDIEVLKDEQFETDGKYVIYNYGHEIVYWNIYFSDGESRVFIEKPDNFKLLADWLDEFFVEGYDNRDIIMCPIWYRAKIKLMSCDSVCADGTDWDANQFKYNITKSRDGDFVYYATEYQFKDYENYTIDLYNAKPGKLLYYYQTQKGNIIARHSQNGNLPFNYVNIEQDDKGFVYNTSSQTYTLKVKPVYVDNIYKVALTGLADTDALSGGYGDDADGYSENKYKITDLLGYQDYPTTNIYTSIEKYIEEHVNPIKSDYINKIASGNLAMLRKVFGSGVNRYIYLANNQPAGDLPVFERDYYDLIAWDNGNVSNKSYKTDAYVEDDHYAEFCIKSGCSHDEISECELFIRDIDEEPYWTLTESGAENSETLVFDAHYFRKYYLLDLNTLHKETNEEGGYGYIYINIDDKTTADDQNGQYIAVYQGDEMQYFDVDYSSGVHSINGKTAFVGNLIHPEKVGETTIYYIRLYAGCDISIKSSCVDWFADNDSDDDALTYQDMVGYYLDSIKTTNDGIDKNTNIAKPAFFTDVDYNGITNKKAGSHVVTVSESYIEDKNYSTKTKITINACFKPIIYNIKITLKTNDVENKFAGVLEMGSLKTSSQNGAVITVSGNVKSFEQIIEYFSNAGYTLCVDAFTSIQCGGEAITLQAYNKEEVTSEDNSQNYALKLDGAWLIKYYYINSYDATIEYAGVAESEETYHEPTSAQTLQINTNTELFSFEYIVNIYDQDGNSVETRACEISEKYVQMDGNKAGSNNANFIVSEKTFTSVGQELIGSEFESYTDVYGNSFYVVNALNCTAMHTHDDNCYAKYAILSSNVSGLNAGYKFGVLEYDFLLNSLSANGINLSQSDMNDMFGYNIIVAPDCRKVYINITVAELYTITMKVKAHEKQDTNSTIRTTTISNGNNNTKTLQTDSGSDYSETKTVYTYKGLTNYISSTFVGKRYQGVTYNLDNSSSNLTGNSFVVNGNVDLIITYLPKPITTFNIEYMLDGNRVDNLNEIINEIDKPNSTIEKYIGEAVTYKFELSNVLYTVTLTLNGQSIENEYFNCVVTDDIYNDEAFNLLVSAVERPAEIAMFKYLLIDGHTSEDYGTFDVFVRGAKQTLEQDANGWYYVNISETSEVKLDLTNIKPGYHFALLKDTNGLEITKTISGNIVTVTESYDKKDNNSYYIGIVCDTVNVTLNAHSNEYKIMHKNAQQTTGVSTLATCNGEIINFSYVDNDREVLDYYYYLDKDGETRHKIITNYDDEIKTYIISLTIDETVLSNIEKETNGEWILNLGVKTKFKYNLDYTIINKMNAESLSVKIGETDYVSKTNVLAGTEIDVDVIVKGLVDLQPNDDAKYNIIFEGCINETFTSGVVNKTITLNSNKILTITISPKEYGINYTEHLYNSLDQLKALNPDKLENLNIADFEVRGAAAYGNYVTLSFNRVVDAVGDLAVIRLNGNDRNNLIIRVSYGNGVDLKVVSVVDLGDTADETDDQEYVAYDAVVLLTEMGYNITFAGNKVQIGYIVNNGLAVSLEYASYKTITVNPDMAE